MNMPNPERIAESTTLVVLSRLSMLVTPVLITAIIFFGRFWIDSRFDAQAAISTDLRQDVDQLGEEIPSAKERIRVIETTMVRGREDREEFQRRTDAKLDQITTILTAIVQEQAALRATVEAQQRQLDRRR